MVPVCAKGLNLRLLVILSSFIYVIAGIAGRIRGLHMLPLENIKKFDRFPE